MEVHSSKLSKQLRPTEMFLHTVSAHAQECMTAFQLDFTWPILETKIACSCHDYV